MEAEQDSLGQHRPQSGRGLCELYQVLVVESPCHIPPGKPNRSNAGWWTAGPPRSCSGHHGTELVNGSIWPSGLAAGLGHLHFLFL